MIIKKPDGQVASEGATLQTYFGRKEGQTLADFLAETKKLTPEAKTELAGLAAQQLGYTVEP